MDDLDEELLALHGGQQKRTSTAQELKSKKKRRVVSDSDSESDESQGDVASSSEGEQSEDEQQAPRRLQKRRAAEPAQAPPSSDEDSDDDEMAEVNKYDEEGYGDDDDRERLYQLNDIEREQELAERVERRRQLQQRQNLRRKASQQKNQVNVQAERESRKRTPGASEKDNRKAALDDLRRKKAGDTAKQRKQARQAARGDDSDEEMAEDSEEEQSDYDSPVEEPYEQFQQQQALEELEWPELRGIIPDLFLKRSLLEEWHDKPYFESSVVGCFVKLNIGMSRETNQPTYRLCQVVGVKDVMKSYKLSSGVWCKQYMVCTFGQDRKSFSIAVSSNEPPDEKIMEKWRAKCEKDNLELPSRQEIEEAQDRLDNAKNFVYDDTVIDGMVAGGDVTKQGNMAIQKARIKVLRDAAAQEGDQEAFEKFSLRLEELLETEDSTKKHIRDNKLEHVASGVTHINSKNREANRKVEMEIGYKNKKARDDGTDIVRRPTKNVEYFDLGDGTADVGTPRVVEEVLQKKVEVVKKTHIEQIKELDINIDLDRLNAAKPLLKCPRKNVPNLLQKKFKKTLSLEKYNKLVED